MKKLLAIILALVMCASVGMMAFATEITDDDKAVGSAGEFDENYQANTDVNILVKTSNISVTVPLEVTIVADVMGGTCAVPDNYIIDNNSLVGIKVSNIKISSVDSGWALCETARSASDAQLVDGTNDLYMTINQQSLYEVYNSADNSLAIDWAVAADSTLDLPLAASSSMLDSADATTDAVVVVYTIEVA